MRAVLKAIAVGGAVALSMSAVAAGQSASHRRPRPRPRPSVAIGVHESEYKIRLSRQTLRHGHVVVELRNLGQDPHNLVVALATGPGPSYTFPTGRPGSRQTRVLKLSRGSWLLFCSLPGHEQLGMKATIVVS